MLLFSPLLCNSEQSTIMTVDFNLLNTFPRWLTVLLSITFITTSFPDLKHFLLPIYGNSNTITPPPSFQVPWFTLSLATDFTRKRVKLRRQKADDQDLLDTSSSSIDDHSGEFNDIPDMPPL